MMAQAAFRLPCDAMTVSFVGWVSRLKIYMSLELYIFRQTGTM